MILFFLSSFHALYYSCPLVFAGNWFQDPSRPLVSPLCTWVWSVVGWIHGCETCGCRRPTFLWFSHFNTYYSSPFPGYSFTFMFLLWSCYILKGLTQITLVNTIQLATSQSLATLLVIPPWSPPSPILSFYIVIINSPHFSKIQQTGTHLN